MRVKSRSNQPIFNQSYSHTQTSIQFSLFFLSFSICLLFTKLILWMCFLAVRAFYWLLKIIRQKLNARAFVSEEKKKSQNNDISWCQKKKKNGERVLHANWIKLSGIKMKLFSNKHKYSINPKIDYYLAAAAEYRFLHADAMKTKSRTGEFFFLFRILSRFYYFSFPLILLSMKRIWYVVTMWHTPCYSPITSIISIVLINYGNLFSHINPKYL